MANSFKLKFTSVKQAHPAASRVIHIEIIIVIMLQIIALYLSSPSCAKEVCLSLKKLGIFLDEWLSMSSVLNYLPGLSLINRTAVGS